MQVMKREIREKHRKTRNRLVHKSFQEGNRDKDIVFNALRFWIIKCKTCKYEH